MTWQYCADRCKVVSKFFDKVFIYFVTHSSDVVFIVESQDDTNIVETANLSPINSIESLKMLGWNRDNKK